MIRKSLPIVLLGLIGLLSMAAIKLLPDTLYFPVVEYATPDYVRLVMLTQGEPDKPGCELSAARLTNAIRANCPNCTYAASCSRGLDDAQKKIFSGEPLAVPSLRTQAGNLMMTISAQDPQVALGVCKMAEQRSAALAIEKRLRCFPAMASR